MAPHSNKEDSACGNSPSQNTMNRRTRSQSTDDSKMNNYNNDCDNNCDNHGDTIMLHTKYSMDGESIYDFDPSLSFGSIIFPLKCTDKHDLSFSRDYIKSGYLDMEDNFLEKCYKHRRVSRLTHNINEMSNDILQCGEHCLDDYVSCLEDRCMFATIGYKLHTLFSWHNETINIYTHLVPAIISSISLILQLFETWTVSNSNHTMVSMRHFLINTFVISMISCFLLSSYYHMQCCISPSLQPKYLKIDMLGIWCLVVGSFVAGFYVIFECYPYWQQLYLSLFLGFLVLIMIPMWFIWPDKTSFVVKEISMTVFIGSGIIPVIHWWAIADENEMRHFWFGPVFMFGFYLLGFVFFHWHIPECWFPYTFDFIGSSHQIWHLCVLAAAMSWWYALDTLAEWRAVEHCAYL